MHHHKRRLICANFVKCKLRVEIRDFDIFHLEQVSQMGDQQESFDILHFGENTT